MAYTALEKMRRRNYALYGRDTGPCQPSLAGGGLERTDLKSAALRFIHERCEELKFDSGIEQTEEKTGTFRGTSLKPGQIPYNMQMDINRLCLERALERFIDSGVAEDAYEVYYCFMEIFFGDYSRSKKMVELLAEFESNGSSLLMKHRDHYSHSVYVFALGLALYETNKAFRRVFAEFYHLDTDEVSTGRNCRAANLFLEFWGLTSLFHDIGYPFELPFEQVLSYFEVEHVERGRGILYLAYHDLDRLLVLDESASARFGELYGKSFGRVTEVLAHDLSAKLGERYGFSREEMLDIIERKPTAPADFGYYMDHAFFSACRLYRELEKSAGIGNIGRMHVDALSAIVLHNSLFKYSIAFYRETEKYKGPLRMKDHPLAYMLMLCDELQCWDRTAYGRNTRTELHPMTAEFDFAGGGIHACYYYDSAEQDKIDAFRESYRNWEINGEKGPAPRLKAYSDMAEKEKRFTSEIKLIVDISEVPLHIVPSTKQYSRRSKHTFLSDSNFLHLYDLAVALHGRNRDPDTPTEELERQFEALSLEYQLSTLNRAKYFSRCLDAIRCFYTDKPVDYAMVTEFTPEQAAVIAPMEHERWIREHQMMGWVSGTDYETLPLPDGINPDTPKGREMRRAMREQMRCHKLAMEGTVTSEDIRNHYRSLSEEDQGKDWKPFNSMLQILKKFDGLRIYSLD